jgi:hypothetical protein
MTRQQASTCLSMVEMGGIGTPVHLFVKPQVLNTRDRPAPVLASATGPYYFVAGVHDYL